MAFPKRWDLPSTLRHLVAVDVEVEAFNDVLHSFDHDPSGYDASQVKSQSGEAISALARLEADANEAKTAIARSVQRAQEQEREERSTPKRPREV